MLRQDQVSALISRERAELEKKYFCSVFKWCVTFATATANRMYQPAYLVCCSLQLVYQVDSWFPLFPVHCCPHTSNTQLSHDTGIHKHMLNVSENHWNAEHWSKDHHYHHLNITHIRWRIRGFFETKVWRGVKQNIQGPVVTCSGLYCPFSTHSGTKAMMG